MNLRYYNHIWQNIIDDDLLIGGEAQLSDADFVISLFMHFCDVKSSGAGQR